MYADTYEFCERLEKFYASQFGFTCDSAPPDGVELPFSLSSLRGLINIPYGNTKAYGSFQGCINVKQEFERNDTTHNVFNINHLNGQYVRLSVDPNFEALNPDSKETRLAGIIGIGGIVKPIIDQVFNSSEILSSVSNYLQFFLNNSIMHKCALFQTKLLYQFIVQSSFLTAEFAWAMCVPDACTPGDISISSNVLFYQAGPKATIISKILTDENKREEMDNFAITMM